MQSFEICTGSSPEVRSVDSFWLLLAVTGNTRTVYQMNSHNIPVFLRFRMETFPSISSHKWKCLLTQTLSRSQSYNITIRTYLTIPPFFPRCLYKIHPNCLSIILIKPLSLGFQKYVIISCS